MQNPYQIFQTIQQRFPVVFWSVSWPDSQLIYISPSVDAFLGYPVSFFSQHGYFLRNIIHPDDQDLERIAMSRLQQSGADQSQFRILHGDGSIKWIENRMVATLEQGQIVRIDGVIQDVTIQKRVEEQLINQKAFLQNVIDTVPNLLYVRDEEGRFVLANQAVAKWYHTTVDDLIGKTDFDFHSSKEEASRFIEDDQKVIQTKKESVIREEPVSSRSGKTRWMQTVKRLITSPEGQQCILGVSTDITKVKRIQQTLVRYNQFKNLLLRLASDFINLPFEKINETIRSSLKALGEFVSVDRVYLIDYDFDIEKAKVSCEWCADGEESCINDMKQFSLIHIQEWVDQHKAGKEVCYPNIQGITEDPIKKEMDMQGIKSLFALPLLGKKYYGYVGFACVHTHRIFRKEELNLLRLFAKMLVNVYERIHLEQEVKDHQQRMNYLMDEIPGSIWSVSYPDFASMYFSPSSEKLYGRPLSEIVGNEDIEFEFTHPDDIPLAEEAFTILEKNGYSEFEYRLIRPDQSTIWVNSKMRAVIENGKIVRIHGIDTDVTERKEMEKLLLKAKKEAEMASIAKSRFLSNMSHELRTPLTGIIGFADSLKSTKLTKEQEFLLNHIITASKALKDVVGNVLDISKIEAGKLELLPRLTDLRHLCEQTIGMVQFQANSKSISIQLEYDSDIPDVIIDPLRLQQVLLNLMGNAIKFTLDNGQVVLRVATESEKPLCLRFEVIDTGIGISEEHQAHIFQPFEQVDNSPTRQFSGTGLGLAISAELIRLMGSQIHVRSKPSEGSSFFCTIRAPESGK